MPEREARSYIRPYRMTNTMKDNSSCSTFFALGFAWAFYSAKYLPAGFHLLSAFFLSAVGTTSSSPPAGGGSSRTVGAFLFAAAAGMAGGTAFSSNPGLSEAVPVFGLPPESIVRIEGVCADDSRLVPSGRTLFPFEILRVYDRRGNSASARGRIMGLSEERIRVFWGRRLDLEGRLLPARDDETIFAVAPGGIVIREGGNPFFRLRERGMRSLGSVIDSLGKPAGDLFEALFLGYRDDVPAALKDSFVKAGAVHLLALSGMHLALVAAFFSVLLRPVRNRTVRDSLSFLLILSYVAFVGPKPSILRAAVMFVVYFIMRLLRRNTDAWQTLVLSFIVYAAARPIDLSALSFILSFLAMAGLILFTRPVQIRLRPYLPEPLLSPMAISIAAQLATSPVLAVEFGMVYPAGILSTLILGPLVTIHLWIGIAACLCHPVAALRSGFAWTMKILYTAAVKTADACAGIPAWTLSSFGSRIAFWGALALGFALLVLPRGGRSGRKP